MSIPPESTVVLSSPVTLNDLILLKIREKMYKAWVFHVTFREFSLIILHKIPGIQSTKFGKYLLKNFKKTSKRRELGSSKIKMVKYHREKGFNFRRAIKSA